MPLPSPKSLDRPTICNWQDWLRLICFGLCMGTADIIPGISGGTIAYIMGFYEDLLNSIKSLNAQALRKLFTGKLRDFFHLVSWKFLLGLMLGIVIAMASLAHLVTFILNHEHYRVFLYASFIGLIVAASILCGMQIRQWKFSHVFILILTALIAYFLTGSVPTPKFSENLYDVKLENVHFQQSLRNFDADAQMLKEVPQSTVSAMLAKGILQPSTLAYSHMEQVFGPLGSFIQSQHAKSFDGWVILCGAIAITAMILPGISGSYLLNVLGMYAIVVGALADFVKGLTHAHFDFSAFMILANMLIGILLGAIIFTRFVSWILNRYHDLTIAALTGFMVGALRSVWPFWSYQYALLPLHPEKGPQLEVIDPIFPTFMSPETWMAVLLALGGAGLVFGLHYLANIKAKSEQISKLPT